MSAKEIRTINCILKELKHLFIGSKTEKLLYLGEEPNPEEKGSGSTYGEMALILPMYDRAILRFRTSARIKEWYKDQKN